MKLLNIILKKITIFQKILIKKYYSNYIEATLNEKIFRTNLFYRICKDISEYVIKNNVNVEEFIKNFDQESKETVKEFLEKTYYIYTHNVLEIKKLFNLEDIRKAQEIKEFINTLPAKIKLSNKQYDISVFYYNCGLTDLPQEAINNLKDKDFIDGGAYNGDSAYVFEKFYQPKKIHAFEPILSNYNLLLKTIELSNLKKIVPIKKGLGEKEEILKIIDDGVISHICDKGKEEIQVITIDEYVYKNNLSIGLIKLDIEGFELKALMGAEKTLKQFKPVLLISIYHNGKEFFETIVYIQKLCPEYRSIIRHLEPLTPFAETVLIAW